jgi:hypothetical protein
LLIPLDSENVSVNAKVWARLSLVAQIASYYDMTRKLLIRKTKTNEKYRIISHVTMYRLDMNATWRAAGCIAAKRPSARRAAEFSCEKTFAAERAAPFMHVSVVTRRG